MYGPMPVNCASHASDILRRSRRRRKDTYIFSRLGKIDGSRSVHRSFVIVERTSKLLFLCAQKQGEMREMEAIHGGLIIARKQERLVFAAGKLDRFACRGIPCAR